MAGRPRGIPKTGGRTRGTPNKSTIQFSEELEEKGFNLSSAITDLYNSTQNEAIKMQLIELVTKYKHPVPKSIDIPIVEEEQEDLHSTESTEDLLKLIE